ALRSALRAVPGGTGTGLAEVRAVLGAHWREAAGHHGMNIALSAPSMLQPVIIGATVSAVSNAAFTTVRLVSMLAFMAPYALAMALFAAAAADPGSLRARSRTVFRVSLGLSLVLYAVLFVSAPLVLRVFGAGYVTSATHYLRIIGIACPLLVFKDQYIAQTRADHRSATAMPYVVASTVLEIAGTYAGSLVAGLAGALVGWLTALALGVGYVCLRWHRDRGVVDTGA
ncbi:MAG TPA: hypothetical protein VJT31_36340, partial [Rugosimonospora sp.]|nr:hypothetical protein [Rugosimonospora sp.]